MLVIDIHATAQLINVDEIFYDRRELIDLLVWGSMSAQPGLP